MAKKPSSRVNIILSLKDDFSRGISKAMIKMDRFAASAKRAGLAMVGAGVAIGAALGKTIVLAGRLDTKIRSLATKLQKSFGSQEIAMLTKKMRHLGATTSYTTSQVADLMVILAQSGKNAGQIDKMTASVMNLAKATGTDAAESAGILSDIMGTFHIDAKKAAHVADVLTKTASASNQTLADLGEGFKGIGAAAFTAGQSFETTAAMLAMLANEGLRGSAAGRGLRSGLLKAITAGKSTLDKFGVSIKNANGEMRDMPDILRDFNHAIRNLDDDKKLEAIDDAFGKIGLTAAAILGNNAKKANQFRGELEKLKDTAKDAAGDMLGGIEGSFAKLMSRLESIALVIGNRLIPIINKLIKTIDKALDNPEMVVVIGQISVYALAAVPALIALGGSLVVLGSVAQVALGSLTLVSSTLIGLASLGKGVALAGVKKAIPASKKLLSLTTDLSKELIKQSEIARKLPYVDAAKKQLSISKSQLKNAKRLFQEDTLGKKQLRNINRLAKNRVFLESQAVRVSKGLATVQKGILQTNIDLAKLTPRQNPTMLRGELSSLLKKEKFLLGAKSDSMAALSKIATKNRSTSYLASLANVKKLKKARLAANMAVGKSLFKLVPKVTAQSFISPLMGAAMVADYAGKLATGVVPAAEMVGHAFSGQTYKGLFKGGMQAIKEITTSLPDLMAIAGLNSGKGFWDAFTEVGMEAMNTMYKNMPAGLKGTLEKIDKFEGSTAGQTASSLSFGTGQMGRMLMSPIDGLRESINALTFGESHYRDGEAATFGRSLGLAFGQLASIDAQARRDAARPMAYGSSDYENRFGIAVQPSMGRGGGKLTGGSRGVASELAEEQLIPKQMLSGNEPLKDRLDAIKLKNELLDNFTKTNKEGFQQFSDKQIAEMQSLYKKFGRIAISSAEMTEAAVARRRQKISENVGKDMANDALSDKIDSGLVNLLMDDINAMVSKQSLASKAGDTFSGLATFATDLVNKAVVNIPSADPFLDPSPQFTANISEAFRKGIENVSAFKDMVVDNKKSIAKKRLDQMKGDAKTVKSVKDSFGALGGVGVRQKLAQKQNEVQEQQLDAQNRMAESLRNIEKQQLTAIVAE